MAKKIPKKIEDLEDPIDIENAKKLMQHEDMTEAEAVRSILAGDDLLEGGLGVARGELNVVEFMQMGVEMVTTLGKGDRINPMLDSYFRKIMKMLIDIGEVDMDDLQRWFREP